MLFETLNQSYIFLGALYFGILQGCAFEVLNFISKLFKKNKVALFLRDLIFCLLSSQLFIHCINKINFGEFRLYIFLAYIVGFIIEKISIGYLLAFLIEKMYNFLKFLVNKLLKIKFIKRCVINDRTTSTKDI